MNAPLADYSIPGTKHIVLYTVFARLRENYQIESEANIVVFSSTSKSSHGDEECTESIKEQLKRKLLPSKVIISIIYLTR